jgi:VanZ family protein
MQDTECPAHRFCSVLAAFYSFCEAVSGISGPDTHLKKLELCRKFLQNVKYLVSLSIRLAVIEKMARDRDRRRITAVNYISLVSYIFLKC